MTTYRKPATRFIAYVMTQARVAGIRQRHDYPAFAFWSRLACAALLAGPLTEARSAAAEKPALVVREEPDRITVTCDKPLKWRAVVDRTHGGVISAFHLPADGPNLIPGDQDPDGKVVSHFRGLFNAFYVTRPKDPKAKNPRGTLWLQPGNHCQLSILKRDEQEVVIEVRGTASGWARIVPAEEKMVEYRQTYTFRSDRIGCDGEMTWVYPHETRMAGMKLESALASDQIAYPVHALFGGQGRVAVPLTSSGGNALPAGISYPMSLEIRLMNGHRLEFRASQVPALMEKNRWYALERPWQQDWAQCIGWSATARTPEDEIPSGTPQHYRYEMVMGRLAANEIPPRLTITSPQRDRLNHPLGETVRFSAEAIDAEGKRIPSENFQWSLYHHYTQLVARHPGDAFSYEIPSTAAQINNGESVWAAVTVTDAAGRICRSYIARDYDRKAPATQSTAPFTWHTATPASQGLSRARLDAFKEHLAAHATSGFLLLRNDKIVYEWYAPGSSATSKQGTASMAKAIVAGTAVAVALNDGRAALDDPAANFIPQWRNDPAKSRITLRQLGSHTSGLDDAEEDEIAHENLTGWKGDFWKRLDPPRDPFTLARDTTPVVLPPGDRHRYSNPGIAMLTYATTAALRHTPEKDIRTLLHDRVMRPIGVTDDEWIIGYGGTFTVDGLPLIPSWGGGNYTARATARLARLMLNEGRWNGQQILTREAVHAVTDDAGTPGRNGIGWWSNNDNSIEVLPRDAFWGSGAGSKVVLIIPSLKLIAVRTGQSLDPSVPNDVGLEAQFFKPIMEAIEMDRWGTIRGGSPDL